MRALRLAPRLRDGVEADERRKEDGDGSREAKKIERSGGDGRDLDPFLTGKRGREIRKEEERRGREAREMEERCRKGRALPTDLCAEPQPR